MSWAHWSDGYIKIYIVGEVPGSNPADSHYILYNNINQTNGGHVAPMDWATCLHIICHQPDTCQLPIRHPATNKNLPHHHRTVVRPVRPCHVRPYGLYGLVQSASNIFACLAWRTDRDIFSIRTPFEKVNIPPESGRRDRRNGTVFVAFRAL
jgi:hypothetical protein